MRVEKEPTDISKFIQDVSCIDDATALIKKDFGQENEIWIRAFIDNRPRGSIKESELVTLDGDPEIRDPVLRLNRMRFNETMPRIYANIMKNKKIQTPFKANWIDEF